MLKSERDNPVAFCESRSVHASLECSPVNAVGVSRVSVNPVSVNHVSVNRVFVSIPLMNRLRVAAVWRIKSGGSSLVDKVW